VAKGIDPARAQQSDTAAMGFPQVVAEWLKRDQADNKASSLYAVQRVVEYDLLPAWRNRRIDQISKRDVLDLLDGIIDRGAPSMARRVYAHLHAFFKWCLGRDIITIDPMASVSKPNGTVARDRVLKPEELAAVYRAAEELGPAGTVVRLLALTGCRLNEIAQLTWPELNGVAINLPGARTKNGKPHVIPLSSAAKALLGTVVPVADCDFVFTVGGKKPVSSWTNNKALLDKASGVTDWRVHDLRRTCATGMAELGVQPHIVEAVLNHVSGHKGGVAGVYNKATYSTEKAEALETWGAHVTALVEAR
jgi:integrase